MSDKLQKSNTVLSIVIQTITIAAIVGGGIKIYADKVIEKKINDTVGIEMKKVTNSIENLTLFIESITPKEKIDAFRDKKNKGLKSVILED